MDPIQYFNENKVKCLRVIYKYRDNEKKILGFTKRLSNICSYNNEYIYIIISRYNYHNEKKIELLLGQNYYSFEDVKLLTSCFYLKDMTHIKIIYKIPEAWGLLFLVYISHEILSPKENILHKCKKTFDIKFLFK
jgi:hypothetical protein